MIKKILFVLFIVIIPIGLASALTIDKRPDKGVILRDKVYTDVSYETYKTNIATKITNNKTKPVDFSEGEDWKDIVKIEIKKCGTWTLTDVTTDNLIEKLNDKLKSGKC